jgi:hypothetical protein
MHLMLQHQMRVVNWPAAAALRHVNMCHAEANSATMAQLLFLKNSQKHNK